MKKILLIGDSIRIGYDKYIKMAFDGVADVVYPEENTRFAAYVFRRLPDLQKLFGDADLVHWNAGLWDCLIMHDGLNFTDIEVYKSYMERACVGFKRFFPNAKFIFATSTSVTESGYNPNGLRRLNADIEAYNKAAVEIVTKHGMTVNDLYSLTKDMPEEYHSDMTHYYTKSGTRVITDRVKSFIENALGIKAKELDYEALFAEKTDVIGI